MNVADRMFEAEWRYYHVFVEVALDLHGGRSWEDVAPLLEAVWKQGDCGMDWETVVPMLRMQWGGGRRRPKPPPIAAQS